MAYTIPKTWAVDGLLGATDMNTYVRDNVAALKNPPSFLTAFASGALMLSTTATTFTAISSALSASLGTYGGDIMVFIQLQLAGDTDTRRISLDWLVNGTALYGAYAFGAGRARPGANTAATGNTTVFGPLLVTGLASGTHVFQPVWKTEAGTAFTWATTGAAPIIMWVREVS
jgi:hypothetical protein